MHNRKGEIPNLESQLPHNFAPFLHIVLRNLTPSLLHLVLKVFKNNGKEVIVGCITCTTRAYFDLIHQRR